MPSPRRTTVFAAALVAAVLAAPAALGHDSLYDRRQQLDSRMSQLRDQIASAKHKEGVLSTRIEAAGADIDSLESEIGAISERLAVLESELAEHRARLARLEDRFRRQTEDLKRLVREHARAQARLEERLVELYETDSTTALEILLQVESLNDLIEQIDYMNEIGLQDRRIVAELTRLEGEMRRARKRTAALKAEVAEATAVLAEKTEEQRAARAELLARQDALEAAQSAQRELLAGVREDRHGAEEDLAALEAAGAQLAAQIQASASSSGGSSGGSSGDSSSGDSSSGDSSSDSSSGGSASDGGGGDSTPSSSGFVWPVSGTVTSGYGTRWGRLHAGIDISAPTGTSVRAAASGRVIYAGWMGGYGQIIVIDHGGGLATAYAHLSSIWAGGSVSQGQAIGAVGCTGSCTGSHLHFEVRVNGSPVNPLSYL